MTEARKQELLKSLEHVRKNRPAQFYMNGSEEFRFILDRIKAQK